MDEVLRASIYTSLKNISTLCFKDKQKMKIFWLLIHHAIGIDNEKTPVNFEKTPVNFEKTPVNFEKTPVNFEKTPVNFEKTPVNLDAF
ncbi:hypothetical protein [Aestuariivivens sediminis]|uniref:hypothetical protein n=1 Tax=Aestuariivivens sediminis TaxID=2913557 RepID=UPI001F589179|nr:hypothetical protein [Aestuariivivens sediminis]